MSRERPYYMLFKNEVFMEKTSPKKLRARLKEFLDMAKKEAVRIERRSGQCFILLSEEKYNDLKTELNILQKRLLGKSHVDAKVDKKKMKAVAKDLKKKARGTKKVSKKATKKVAKKTTKKISKTKT